MTIDAPRITVDLDQPCPRCGKPGAANGGLCLSCLCKAMQTGELDHLLASSPPKKVGGHDR